ncbi:MAG: alpha/beta fold hydrolase [Erythrobacter sp.]
MLNNAAIAKGVGRRSILRGAAGIASATLASGCVSASTSSPRDFVLIHGAWHGGWCWEQVRQLLESAGHRVHTPTLPGLAERAGEMSPDIGLAEHITDAIGFVEASGLRNIVLVGHSYGGMVITGMADAMKDRIAHIVYLDAALPKNGESMISYGAPRSQAAIDGAAKTIKGLAPDGIAMAAFPASLLGISEDHPLHNWTNERLTPHPLKTWLDPIVLTNGGSDGLPRTYVHCTSPALPQTQFPYIAALAANDPSWQSIELATGHDAMITAPQDCAALFEQAALASIQGS